MIPIVGIIITLIVRTSYQCVHQKEPRSHPWFLFICVKGVAGIIVKTRVAEKKISYDRLIKSRQNGKFIKKTK